MKSPICVRLEAPLEQPRDIFDVGVGCDGGVVKFWDGFESSLGMTGGCPELSGLQTFTTSNTTSLVDPGDVGDDHDPRVNRGCPVGSDELPFPEPCI